jgi:hypothetical protein
LFPPVISLLAFRAAIAPDAKLDHSSGSFLNFSLKNPPFSLIPAPQL